MFAILQINVMLHQLLINLNSSFWALFFDTIGNLRHGDSLLSVTCGFTRSIYHNTYPLRLRSPLRIFFSWLFCVLISELSCWRNWLMAAANSELCSWVKSLRESERWLVRAAISAALAVVIDNFFVNIAKDYDLR